MFQLYCRQRKEPCFRPSQCRWKTTKEIGVSVEIILHNAKIAPDGILRLRELCCSRRKRQRMQRWTPALKQILARPGIELLQDRPKLPSERGRRVFNPHRHLREHLPFDKTIPLKFSQLLRQYLLRDSRNALPQNFEPQWLFAVDKPPQNYWLPSAANQDQ
jgi:hypothetical protein